MIDTYPTRTRGRAGRAVWGGIHLTYYRYLPSFLLKMIAMTEFDTSRTKHLLEEVLTGLRRGDNVSTIARIPREWLVRAFGSRERKIKGKIERNGRVIPWFIKCNPGRYQYFFGTTINDARLEKGGIPCSAHATQT
jgi:hypothetical protein